MSTLTPKVHFAYLPSMLTARSTSAYSIMYISKISFTNLSERASPKVWNTYRSALKDLILFFSMSTGNLFNLFGLYSCRAQYNILSFIHVCKHLKKLGFLFLYVKCWVSWFFRSLLSDQAKWRPFDDQSETNEQQIRFIRIYNVASNHLSLPVRS